MLIGEMFAGYGGLGLALGQIWPSRTLWHAEIDPWASHVLRSHSDEAPEGPVPNYGDVTTVNWDRVPPVDILTAGFPCQDISIAGFRAGIRPGTRSGLWSHVAYAIDRLRPELVVIENVRELRSTPAHSDVEPCPRCLGDDLHAPRLRALGRVLGDLATLGYDARWHSNRASDIGAPHRRERVFVIAKPADTQWPTCEPHRRLTSEPSLPAHRSVRLPSPRASDGTGAGVHGTGGPDLRQALSQLPGSLLPSPTSRDGKGHNQRRDTSCLEGALLPPQLLPTPAVNDMGDGKTHGQWETWRSKQLAKHRNTNGHGPSLAQETAHSFGKYAPAIRHWENLTRPAPPPTQPGIRTAARANVAFVEWMMGLPQGHVAGRLPRKPAMKLLGNGVVPQQAEHAIREMLNWEDA